jgi:hypothetical protein
MRRVGWAGRARRFRAALRSTCSLRAVGTGRPAVGSSPVRSPVRARPESARGGSARRPETAAAGGLRMADPGFDVIVTIASDVGAVTVPLITGIGCPSGGGEPTDRHRVTIGIN